MKFFTSLVFFITIIFGSFAQTPTINAFAANTTAAPGFSGATGTTMTITGTNFTGATAVTFGGTPAASFTVVNSTTITAVVGGGSSGIVSVTTPVNTATQAGFTYLPLSRIVTDFGGYWSSTTASANATNPDDAHNLLGYSYNSTFYSTGVNDATLTANGVSFTAGNYRSLPVAGITGTNASGSSVYLAMASKVDGNASSAVVSGVASSTVKSVLIDGTRGLGLGTGVTNLPATAVLSFTIHSIDVTKISDAEPDIIITQIADPSAGNDIFQFVNSSGALVGNQITQDMTVLTSFGNYKLDLFSLQNTLYNAATPLASVNAGAGTRGIRLVAFKLSDFGITSGNVASVKALKITPSGNSDYAFIAYNANSINIPPSISQNDATTISTVCANGTAILNVISTAASGGGLTYFWERSSNGGSSWSTVTDGGNFSGATTSGLSVTNPVNADQYRATVTESGSGYASTSSVFTLTVSPVSAGGSVSGGATVCTGTNSTNLTLSGNTGSVVRWESSTDNFSTLTTIVNTTTTNTATNLTATTKYRAVVQSGSCTSANSSSATVTVSAASVGGSVSGGATVCTGTNSTNLTLSGNTGSVVRWESSTDNFSTVTTISNTTTSLTASNLTATTQYRAVVQSGSCASANSSSSTVTVSAASVGGSVTGGTTVCTGTNSTVLALSGNTGSVVRWESSTDNFSTVTTISNTTTSLTASNLTATTQYRAVVQSGSCASATSSSATVTVSAASVGGSVSGGATVCTGTNSTVLALSGNTGSVVRWESSTDNFSTVTIISNTTTSLTASNLTATTQYRAVVQSGSCTSANSSSSTVTVSAASVGGSVTGGGTVCTGTNSTTLTLNGNTGSVVRWESSTDNFSSIITTVANITTSLTATNLTVTTQYRAVVLNGSCTSANSSSSAVTVSAASVGGSVTGGATVCTGTNSTTLTLSGNTGGILRWESSVDNFSTVTTISTTTTTYTASNLTATTKYRAVVQSGSCTSANSSSATVTVSSASVGGSVTGNASACSGTNSTALTLSGNTGSVVSWESSTNNFSTVTTIANTTTTYTATNLTVTTQYRAVVQSGSCSAATSSSATVTVITGQWIGGASGDWSNPANWCGGVPTLSTSVSIPSNSTVQIKSDIGVAKSVTIATGANVVMTGNFTLRIADGGTFINNGTFDASGSTGAVSFLGTGTIAGNTTFNNIETYGALDFGTSTTVTGTFTLQPGGSVTGHSPSYSCPGSSLVYNTGSVFSRGMEWASVTSGPGYPSNVTVQNSTTINFPVEGPGYVCNDLTVQNGSSLLQTYSGVSAPLTVGRNVTISGTLSLGNNSGDDITLGGNWTRNAGAVFSSNGRTVTFNSSNNSVITAPASSSRDGNGAFGGETFYNININKSSSSNTVTLSSNISITNEIKVTAGIFDLSNSDVTLVSNGLSTAHVAPVPASGVAIRYGGAGGTGTGKFIVQRYLPIGNGYSSRRWRLLTSPLQPTGAPSINVAWQEGVSNSDRTSPIDPWPGFGTTITKSTTYNSSDGYDQGSTNNPSIYYYSGAGATGWSPPASVKAGAITDQGGYMLFARGNRSIVVSTPVIDANSTILEPKGRINTGTVQKTLVSGYQVIGNPFASAISMNNVVFNNYSSGGSTFNNAQAGSSSGITYYVWDPKTSGSSGVGKFIACSSNGDGTYSVTGNSSSLPTNGTIESSAAFLISSDNSGGTITFHEADKVSASSTTGIASRVSGSAEVSSILVTNLYSGSTAGINIADGVINLYNSAYSDSVGSQDALKISSFNSSEVLSIARKGKLLAIERRSPVTDKDTIFLSISGMNKAAYGFQFIASNFDPSVTAFLEDKFNGTSRPINIADTTYIAFKTGADTASLAANRFSIVFKAGRTLAITTNNVQAFEQNNDIAVQWKVENQLNIKEYLVEKSTDGRNFIKVNTTASKGNASSVINYNWIDNQPVAGSNFYRIKSIQNNGQFTYSEIVKVMIGNLKPIITVYPNPVTEGKITLQFKNEATGNYTVKIINSAGQSVSTKMVSLADANARVTIVPTRTLVSGIYHLQILGPDKQTKTVKVVVLRK